jgi:hypothetical protein
MYENRIFKRDACNEVTRETRATAGDKEKAERQTGKKDSMECPHCSAIIHKETRQDASGDGYKHPK